MYNFQYTCQYFINIFSWSSFLAANINKHKQSNVDPYKSEIQYSHNKIYLHTSNTLKGFFKTDLKKYLAWLPLSVREYLNNAVAEKDKQQP